MRSGTGSIATCRLLTRVTVMSLAHGARTVMSAGRERRKSRTRLIGGIVLWLAVAAVLAEEPRADQASEGSLEAHLIRTNEGNDEAV